MSKQYAIATALVQEYHADQMYGDKPYVYHLLGVAKLVKEGGGDELDQTVALLHDIIEDTECTAHKMHQAGIKMEVIEAVLAITKQNGETHKNYLQRCCANKRARKVKVWDSHFNLTHSLREGNVKRIKRYTGNIAFLAEFKHKEKK